MCNAAIIQPKDSLNEMLDILRNMDVPFTATIGWIILVISLVVAHFYGKSVIELPNRAGHNDKAASGMELQYLQLFGASKRSNAFQISIGGAVLFAKLLAGEKLALTRFSPLPMRVVAGWGCIWRTAHPDQHPEGLIWIRMLGSSSSLCFMMLTAR